MAAKSDAETRLQAVVDGLAEHRLSLADARAKVRELSFPRKQQLSPAQVQRDDVTGDASPDRSLFTVISHAYHSDKIDLRQYEELRQAALESMTPG